MIEGEESLNLFTQLPLSVQMRIFSDYLYHDFLSYYDSFFFALRKLCHEKEYVDNKQSRKSIRYSFAKAA